MTTMLAIICAAVARSVIMVLAMMECIVRGAAGRADQRAGADRHARNHRTGNRTDTCAYRGSSQDMARALGGSRGGGGHCGGARENQQSLHTIFLQPG